MQLEAQFWEKRRWIYGYLRKEREVKYLQSDKYQGTVVVIVGVIDLWVNSCDFWDRWQTS